MNQLLVPDNQQRRALMVKQFGDVLNQLYHKPPLTVDVDAGELFRAAWLALEMTGLPEGVAIPGIQYKMGPDFAQFNRSVLPTVNLNWPGIFGIYETMFRSTYQDPSRTQELSTEYSNMELKVDESVAELVRRIEKAEAVLFELVDKREHSDFDAKMKLYSCVSKCRDVPRRSYILNQLEETEYLNMTYKAMCEFAVKKDRSHARSRVAVDAQKQVGSTAMNTSGSTGHSGGGAVKSTAQQVSGEGIASGANGEQMGRRNWNNFDSPQANRRLSGRPPFQPMRSCAPLSAQPLWSYRYQD
jgi:hypothetical protein